MSRHNSKDMSLCYYKIVDGKQAKVQECDEEIIVTHNEVSYSEEPS